MDAKQQKKTLTYEELEAEFGIKRGTAYGRVHQRTIPHIRLGRRHVLFDREEIEAWLSSHRIAAKCDSQGAA